jgi:hypothetical protein
VIYGSEELIEIESITEEVVTEEVNDELNEAIESEKPKGPRNPSPGKIVFSILMLFRSGVNATNCYYL